MPTLIEGTHFYTLSDREYYDTLDRYRVNRDEFIAPVEAALPSDWTFARDGIWYYATSPGAQFLSQGWKIHLSATPRDSAPVLMTTARYLGARGTPFKFLCDRTLLFVTNMKRWPRGQAGKFVTIYPTSTDDCGEILRELAVRLEGYAGPYILSDRRYRDSKVVYYRYGGIQPIKRLEASGAMRPVMRGEDGSLISDQREAFFQMPSGIVDPFATHESDADASAGTLGGGRYILTGALAHSNAGGVYRATDTTTGRPVVIKEARPHTAISPRHIDSVGLLKKEHRILTLLSGTGVAPEPVDFFRDWEHYYLVEEFLDGRILRGHMVVGAIGLRTKVTSEEARLFYERYCRIYARVAELLQVLHDRQIVFGDLSHYNVMVLREDETIKLIDFEGAYEQGIDEPTFVFTPGFAPSAVLEEGAALAADDRYGLGGLMAAGIMPVNALSALEPSAHHRFLKAWQRDFGLPPAIVQAISGLLSADRAARPSLATVRELLARPFPAMSAPSIGSAEVDEEDVPTLPHRLIEHALTVASYDRTDRLFPSDPTLFRTNPVSVAYGAAGVARAINSVTGSVPDRVLDWILARDLSDKALPPGLYLGMAGVGVTLAACGREAQGLALIRQSAAHPLAPDCPDVFYGQAGVGLAQLKAFAMIGDFECLARARAIGDQLVATRESDGATAWWTSQGALACGLAHGVSGIGLFLLYLGVATREDRYVRVAVQAMGFVLGRGLTDDDGGLTWRAYESEPTHTPYWRWGSAGVGVALLRYWHVLRDPVYREALDRVIQHTDRKYSIFCGQFFGLAGMGEFLLDCASFGVQPERARAGARRVLAGTLLFQLTRPGGVAYPGESLARISWDYGTGGAGIATFVHRFVSRAPTLFLVDELLDSPVRREQATPADELAIA